VRNMNHAAQGLHGRLAEAIAAVPGPHLLKSRFNPTGGVSQIPQLMVIRIDESTSSSLREDRNAIGGHR